MINAANIKILINDEKLYLDIKGLIEKNKSIKILNIEDEDFADIVIVSVSKKKNIEDWRNYFKSKIIFIIPKLNNEFYSKYIQKKYVLDIITENEIFRIQKILKDYNFRLRAKNFISLHKKNIAERKLNRKKTFDENLSIVLLIDAATSKIMQASKAASEFYGYSSDEFKNLKISDINQLSSDDIKIKMKEAVDGKNHRFIFPHKTKTGEIKTVEVYVSPLFINGKKFLQSIIFDITEKHFNQVINNNIHDLICVIDVKGRYLYASKSFENIVGYSVPELIGKTAFEFIHPDDINIAMEAFNRVVNDSSKESAEFRYRYRDGVFHWVESTAVGYYDYGSKNKNYLIVSKDISDRKIVQEQLDEANYRNSYLLESIQAVVWSFDYKNKLFTYFNKSIETILGYTSEDFINDPMFWAKYIHPEDKEWIINYVRDNVKIQEKFVVEFRFISLDKKVLWFRSIISVRKENNIPVELTGFMIDITNRVTTLEKLKESEAKYKELFERNNYIIESINAVVWSYNLKNNKYNYVSKRVEEVLGYTVDNFYKTSDFWLKFVHPEDIHIVTYQLEKLIYEKSDFVIEYRLYTADKKLLWIKSFVSVVKEDGNPVELTGLMIDITDRKFAQQKLEESELKYKELFENSNDSIFIHYADRDNLKFIDSNKAASQLIGYTKEEIRNFEPKDLSTLDREKGNDYLKNIKETGNHIFETTIINKNGRFIPVEINSKLINYDGKKAVLSIVRDISERKSKEEELRYSEEMFRMIFNHHNDAVYVRYFEPGVEYKFFEVNDVACQMLGYTKEELTNLSPKDIDSDAHIIWTNISQGLLKNKMAMFETFHTKKNGKKIPVEISSRLFELKGRVVLASVAKDLTERKIAEAILKKSEQKYKIIFESNPVPMYVYNVENLRFLDANEAALKHYGYSWSELQTKRVIDLFHPKDVDNYLNAVINKSEELNKIGIWNHIKKDKTITKVDLTLFNFESEGVKKRLTAAYDVGERLKTEEELKLFKQIIDSSKEAAIITELDSKVYYANKAFYELSGYEKEVFATLSTEDIYGTEQAKFIKDVIEPSLFSGNSWIGELEFTTASGEKIITRQYYDSIKTNGKPAYIFRFIQDVTENKKVELELTKLGTAVTQNPASIIITDTKGKIEYVNPKFTEVTGYTYEEVIGKNPNILKSGTKPSKEYSELWQLITDGKEWRGEFQNRKKSGELYWEFASISPIRNKDGVITNYIAIKEDITDRKIADEMLKSSLKEKETLLKEIHHRVKNNLQIISSLLSLQSDFIQDEFSKDLFQESMNRIRSMGLIHERLYQSNNLAKIDFGNYINDLTVHLFRTYKLSSNFISLYVDADNVFLPIDYAIPCGLIINELVSNSLKYSSENSKPVNLNVTFKEIAQEKYLLEISDNGKGLPDHLDLENLNSLGLQLVQDLVMQIEGELKVKPKDNTTFKITFSSTEL